MLATLAVVVYLIVGAVLGTVTARYDESEASPPEFQGFMVVTLLWLPVMLYGIGYTIKP